MKRKMILLVLALAVSVTALAGGAYAWFSGNKTVDSIVIKTGSVDFSAELYLASDFNRDGLPDVLDESEKKTADDMRYDAAGADGFYEFTKLSTQTPIVIDTLMPGEIVTFRIDVVNRSTAESAGRISIGLDFGGDASTLGVVTRGRKFNLDGTADEWKTMPAGETYLPIEADTFYSADSARITLLVQVCFWSDGDQGNWNGVGAFDQCKIHIRYDAVNEGTQG